MSLTTTVAGATSDSYCTLAEFREHLYGDALEAWDAMETNAEREAYARRITDIIDMQEYRGDPYSTTQSLAFPMTYHYTTDTETDVDTPFIPPRVKKACYAQMTAMLNGFGDGFSDQILEYRGKGVTNLGMGTGNNMQFVNRVPGARDFLCAEARVLLSPYFSHPSLRVERG